MSFEMLPWPITLFFMFWTLGCVLLMKRSLRIASDIDGWLKNDKKGKNLVAQEGYEKAYNMVKKVGVPLGVLVPLMFLMAGIGTYFLMIDMVTNGQLTVK